MNLMIAPPLVVLYEDNHLLAVVKPPGLATMGLAGGEPTLLSLAKDYVKQRYHKPGNVYLGVVSRLDAPVTGVLLLARTSKAARRLTEQFRSRTVKKTYWALVEGAVRPPAGDYVDWVRHDERHRRMHVARQGMDGVQEARLVYRTLRALEGISLVEVELHTGRKHQIRLQFSAHGHPVVGDRKYGSGRPFSAGIALHARRLVVSHPTNGQPLELVAPLPQAWNRLGVREGDLARDGIVE
jgi:23S rRNA pseudouridine1911/1915/1917 synthase